MAAKSVSCSEDDAAKSNYSSGSNPCTLYDKWLERQTKNNGTNNQFITETDWSQINGYKIPGNQNGEVI